MAWALSRGPPGADGRPMGPLDPLVVIAMSSVICVYSVRLGQAVGFLRGHGGVYFLFPPVTIFSDLYNSPFLPLLFIHEILPTFAAPPQIKRRESTTLMESRPITPRRILSGCRELDPARLARPMVYDHPRGKRNLKRKKYGARDCASLSS